MFPRRIMKWFGGMRSRTMNGIMARAPGLAMNTLVDGAVFGSVPQMITMNT